MNKACHSCGRIITVPDVPLPDDYTQKCPSCGFDNPVNDDYSPQSLATGPLPNSVPAPDEDTWDSSFDHLLDDGLLGAVAKAPPLDSLEEKMIWKLEQKLMDLENRMRREPVAREVQTAEPLDYYGRVLAQQVNTGEILVCSLNDALFSNLEKLLSERGYALTAGDSLEKANLLIKQKHFQFLVLDQAFLNAGEAGKEIFKHIKRTPVAIRRCQTVVLISPSIATCEAQVFYQWSIDLNVHPRDLDRLDEFLTSITRMKAGIYGAYLERAAQPV